MAAYSENTSFAFATQSEADENQSIAFDIGDASRSFTGDRSGLGGGAPGAVSGNRVRSTFALPPRHLQQGSGSGRLTPPLSPPPPIDSNKAKTPPQPVSNASISFKMDTDNNANSNHVLDSPRATSHTQAPSIVSNAHYNTNKSSASASREGSPSQAGGISIGGFAPISPVPRTTNTASLVASPQAALGPSRGKEQKAFNTVVYAGSPHETNYSDNDSVQFNMDISTPRRSRSASPSNLPATAMKFAVPRGSIPLASEHSAAANASTFDESATSFHIATNDGAAHEHVNADAYNGVSPAGKPAAFYPSHRNGTPPSGPTPIPPKGLQLVKALPPGAVVAVKEGGNMIPVKAMPPGGFAGVKVKGKMVMPMPKGMMMMGKKQPQFPPGGAKMVPVPLSSLSPEQRKQVERNHQHFEEEQKHQQHHHAEPSGKSLHQGRSLSAEQRTSQKKFSRNASLNSTGSRHQSPARPSSRSGRLHRSGSGRLSRSQSLHGEPQEKRYSQMRLKQTLRNNILKSPSDRRIEETGPWEANESNDSIQFNVNNSSISAAPSPNSMMLKGDFRSRPAGGSMSFVGTESVQFNVGGTESDMSDFNSSGGIPFTKAQESGGMSNRASPKRTATTKLPLHPQSSSKPPTPLESAKRDSVGAAKRGSGQSSSSPLARVAYIPAADGVGNGSIAFEIVDDAPEDMLGKPLKRKESSIRGGVPLGLTASSGERRSGSTSAAVPLSLARRRESPMRSGQSTDSLNFMVEDSPGASPHEFGVSELQQPSAREGDFLGSDASDSNQRDTQNALDGGYTVAFHQGNSKKKDNEGGSGDSDSAKGIVRPESPNRRGRASPKGNQSKFSSSLQNFARTFLKDRDASLDEPNDQSGGNLTLRDDEYVVQSSPKLQNKSDSTAQKGSRRVSGSERKLISEVSDSMDHTSAYLGSPRSPRSIAKSSFGSRSTAVGPGGGSRKSSPLGTTQGGKRYTVPLPKKGGKLGSPTRRPHGNGTFAGGKKSGPGSGEGGSTSHSFASSSMHSVPRIQRKNTLDPSCFENMQTASVDDADLYRGAKHSPSKKRVQGADDIAQQREKLARRQEYIERMIAEQKRDEEALAEKLRVTQEGTDIRETMDEGSEREQRNAQHVIAELEKEKRARRASATKQRHDMEPQYRRVSFTNSSQHDSNNAANSGSHESGPPFTTTREDSEEALQSVEVTQLLRFARSDSAHWHAFNQLQRREIASLIERIAAARHASRLLTSKLPALLSWGAAAQATNPTDNTFSGARHQSNGSHNAQNASPAGNGYVSMISKSVRRLQDGDGDISPRPRSGHPSPTKRASWNHTGGYGRSRGIAAHNANISPGFIAKRNQNTRAASPPNRYSDGHGVFSTAEILRRVSSESTLQNDTALATIIRRATLHRATHGSPDIYTATAAAFGILWPPSLAPSSNSFLSSVLPSLFFITGVRLTRAQVRQFCQIIQLREAAEAAAAKDLEVLLSDYGLDLRGFSESHFPQTPRTRASSKGRSVSRAKSNSGTQVNAKGQNTERQNCGGVGQKNTTDGEVLEGGENVPNKNRFIGLETYRSERNKPNATTQQNNNNGFIEKDSADLRDSGSRKKPAHHGSRTLVLRKVFRLLDINRSGVVTHADMKLMRRLLREELEAAALNTEGGEEGEGASHTTKGKHHLQHREFLSKYKNRNNFSSTGNCFSLLAAAMEEKRQWSNAAVVNRGLVPASRGTYECRTDAEYLCLTEFTCNVILPILLTSDFLEFDFPTMSMLLLSILGPKPHDKHNNQQNTEAIYEENPSLWFAFMDPNAIESKMHPGKNERINHGKSNGFIINAYDGDAESSNEKDGEHYNPHRNQQRVRASKESVLQAINSHMWQSIVQEYFTVLG